MSQRSTRNQIRRSLHGVIDKLELCVAQLQTVDTLSDGRSEVVNEHMPALVAAIEEIKSVVIDFRDNI